MSAFGFAHVILHLCTYNAQSSTSSLESRRELNVCIYLQAGVHYIEGRATVKDEHTVSINGKDYTVCCIVI